MSKLPTFYVLTITQAFSLLGSRMTSVALGIWVFAATGDVAPILLTSFFLELPGIVGVSLAGVLADRWDRRHAIMLGDAGDALGTLLLALSFFSGRFRLWHLYAAALLKGSFRTVQQPAADSAITMLVPDSLRDRANAVKEMAFPIAGVAAPVLTGFLYPVVDVAGIILIDLATFIAAVLIVSLIHIPRPRQTPEGLQAQGSLWQELRGGLRFLVQRRALLGLVLYMTLVYFLLNGPLELSIPYIVALTGSETLLGILMGVMSLGAFCGAGAMAVWGGTRPRIHTLLAGMLLAGVMMMLYGMVRTPWLLAAVVFLMMFPLPVTNAVFTSILQVKTPPDMQGRLFAAVSQLTFVAAPLSFLVTGPLVDRLAEPAATRPGWRIIAPLVGTQPGAGMALVILVAGLLIVVSSGLVYTLPAIRGLEANLPDYEAIPAGESPLKQTLATESG